MHPYPNSADTCKINPNTLLHREIDKAATVDSDAPFCHPDHHLPHEHSTNKIACLFFIGAAWYQKVCDKQDAAAAPTCIT